MANTIKKDTPGYSADNTQSSYKLRRTAGIPQGAGGQSYPPNVDPGKQMTAAPYQFKGGEALGASYNLKRKAGIPGSPKAHR